MITVAALYCYPVKSCRGLLLLKAPLDQFGIVHDRNWMVVDENGNFLSQRTVPRMCQIGVTLSHGNLVLTAPSVGGGSMCTVPLHRDFLETVHVSVQKSRCRGIDQGDEVAGWLSAFLGRRCRLVRIPDNHHRAADNGSALGGYADGYPFLIVSSASLRELNSRLSQALPMNRFRPNVVVEGCQPYAEDYWRMVRIGLVEFEGMTHCVRCAITTTDQETAGRSREPLTTLGTFRRTLDGVILGRNFNHCSYGTIRVGDPLEVLQEDRGPQFIQRA